MLKYYLSSVTSHHITLLYIGMQCLTDEISSFNWFFLLAVGMAGDETISHVKLL